MPESLIVKLAAFKWFDRGNGLRTARLVGPQVGSSQVLCGMTEFEPDRRAARHFHNCEESVTIMEGAAEVEIAGRVDTAVALETVWIAAGVPHSLSNPGPARLRILWMYPSVSATRTFVENGKTVDIAGEGLPTA